MKFLICMLFVFSQSFSFEMTFTDSLDNSVTIETTLFSDTIEPLDSVFSVRTSNLQFGWGVTVEILTENWPVVVTWDTTLFSDKSYWTYLADWPTWWITDVSTEIPIKSSKLRYKGFRNLEFDCCKIGVSANKPIRIDSNYYVNDNKDTIALFSIGMGTDWPAVKIRAKFKGQETKNNYLINGTNLKTIPDTRHKIIKWAK